MGIELTIESIDCLWDQGKHNAFTDLIWVDDVCYCAFRQASHHMSYDGQIVILRRKNDQAWQPLTQIDWVGGDLRDPKFVISPTGTLMLMAGVRWAIPVSMQSALFSVTWQLNKQGVSVPFVTDKDEGTWRWSASSNLSQIFSIGYAGKDRQGCLYTSKEGKTWQSYVTPFFPNPECFSNEASLVFTDKGIGYCLLRRDGEDCPGLIGTATPPYQDWQWQNLPVRIGGPKMIQLSTGQLIAAVRIFEEEDARTVLFEVLPEQGALKRLLTLPSSGDCSYPGLAEKDGQIWVSYYSSHEEKVAIYLAKLVII